MTPGFAGNDLRQRRRWLAHIATVALVVLGCRAAVPAGAQDDLAADDRPRLGMSIRITLPITSHSVSRAELFIDRALKRAREQDAQPVLIFRFEAAKGQEESARSTKFSDAMDLARLISGNRTAEAQTVAYGPKSITGHAVLAAMACQQIMMPEDGQLGPVGAEPDSIGPTELSEYRQIAERHHTVPTEVALWLLDPSREVVKVVTLAGREYVTLEGPEGLEKLLEDPNVESAERLRDLIEGQPGQLTGQEARRFNSVKYLPASTKDVAKELKVAQGAMKEDPSLVADWRAVRLDLEGAIDGKTVKRAQRLIEDEVQLGEVNFVCVWIDSGGGSPVDSVRLASLLAELDPDKIRTVAYIPSRAQADAALVALACDEVLIHPQAKLGGSGDYRLSEEDVRLAKDAIREEDGPWAARPWALVAAMIDPELKVYRCTRPGEVGYFCEDELNELEKNRPGGWQIGEQITGEKPNRPPFDGQQAVEYGLADDTVQGLAELMDYYGVEELRRLKAGWAYFLIDALARPEVSAVLLMIAFVAMYAELHMPGIGIGGFVATVCFLLFFWSHALDGTAEWLEILLFVAGVGCLMLEVFVLPGFGIFGLGGACLVLVSLVLASQTFVIPSNAYEFGQLQRSLVSIAAAGVGIVGAAALLRRWLPKTPIFSRLFLAPPAGEEAESISHRELLIDLDGFVGARGTTTTQLTPSGKALFGDRLLDVITDGDVVPRGTQIEVVEIHGNRVVVRAVDSG